MDTKHTGEVEIEFTVYCLGMGQIPGPSFGLYLVSFCLIIRI
jgi:hypothetical protein